MQAANWADPGVSMAAAPKFLNFADCFHFCNVVECEYRYTRYTVLVRYLRKAVPVQWPPVPQTPISHDAHDGRYARASGVGARRGSLRSRGAESREKPAAALVSDRRRRPRAGTTAPGCTGP